VDFFFVIAQSQLNRICHSQTMRGYDAFLTDTILIDKSVYKLWLLGFDLEQATTICTKHLPQSACVVKTQYRNFDLLQTYIISTQLSTQMLFALPARTISYLINEYYSFDPRVARELLGMYLSTLYYADLYLSFSRFLLFLTSNII
jgi:hypothetical protein